MATGFLLINAKPGRAWSLALSWFLVCGGDRGGYLWVSQARHAENPEDRVTPTVAQMATGMYNAVMQPAEEDEASVSDGSFWYKLTHSMLWKDTPGYVAALRV